MNIVDKINKFIEEKLFRFKYLKAVFLTIRDFGLEGLGWQAVALSFFSTMAFAPFLAVIFSVTKGFGIETYLIDLIHNTFGKDTEVVNLMMNFAYNIIESAKAGIYGIVSFLIFVWLVVWLLLCVENSFNKIWNVERKRKIQKRFAANMVILISCPFVIIIFLSIFIMMTQGLSDWRLTYPFLGDISQFLNWLMFYGLTLLVFTAMYMFIPRTHVKLVNALKAALLSALAFTVIQFLYVETQIFVSRLNTVYGVFAAIPLFMVWINMAWFTILMGSKLSYTLQQLQTTKTTTKE